MSAGYVQYRKAGTETGPSAALWADCPITQINMDPSVGIHIFDDFTVGGPITSPTTEAHLVGIPYVGFGSAGSTITAVDAQFGAILLTEATTNEAIGIRSTVCPFQISSLLGDLWFECRVKINGTNTGLIVGLWDNTAMTVDIPLSAANPPIMATTGNFVGFRIPEGALTVIGSYDSDDAGQTVDAEVVQAAALGTAVADTYMKLGLRYTQAHPYGAGGTGGGAGTPCISWWFNGVENVASRKIVPNATGTDFPADVRLGFMMFAKLVATAAGTATIDWWRCAQLRVS